MAWIHLLSDGRHLAFVRCDFVRLWRFWQCQGMRILHVESDECKRFERVNSGCQFCEDGLLIHLWYLPCPYDALPHTSPFEVRPRSNVYCPSLIAYSAAIIQSLAERKNCTDLLWKAVW